MATIDTRRVHKELKRIASASQAVKNLLRETLEQIESDPSTFRELRNIPPEITSAGNLVAIRVAEITSHRHDFRLVFAHWRFADESEHVDLLLAFKRKEGYEIDWEWVRQTLE